MLTRSLHTVTAATNVARHLLETRGYGASAVKTLASDALNVLGYPYGANTIEQACLVDRTVDRIVKACELLIMERGA